MTSSISSSRKGRANTDRDENYIEISGNFEELISQWRQRNAGPDEAREYSVEVFPVTAKGGERIHLDESFSVTAKVLRTPSGIYRWTLRCPTQVVREHHIIASADAEVVDIVEAEYASFDEIREALRPPLPPAPEYHKIPRDPNDAASRLGFIVGAAERSIRIGSNWTAVGFHLPSAQIVGAVEVSLEFRANSPDCLELRIFDANGQRLLQVWTRSKAQFDQVRLPAGDILLAYRSAGEYRRGTEIVSGALEGNGSYSYPHARVVTELPEHPNLDEVIAPKSDERCGVPVFRFTA